jgi:DNA (cytosine-5)-methyltransferase 1
VSKKLNSDPKWQNIYIVNFFANQKMVKCINLKSFWFRFIRVGVLNLSKNEGKNFKMKRKIRLKAIDFFCGAGGVTCGFQQAGIDVLCGIDVDENCKLTYEKNNDRQFLKIDISDFKKERLKYEFNIERKQDDLIFVGCSPCQYYSNIKTDKTKSTETRLLLADFQEIVDYYNPGYVFIENVPGVRKKKDSPLGKFKDFLIRKGYSCDDGIINAKYFGVPQSRRRYILIASRITEKISLPKPDSENMKTVKDAIGNYNIFRELKAGEIDKTKFIHSAAGLSDLNLKRIKNTPKDGGNRCVWKDDPELQLRCYTDHKGHYDVYGRMYWDKPAPTITTRFSSYSNGRYGHPEQDRAISLREGATLQSFPPDYNFYSGSQATIAKMIGNAVPPKLAERIGESMIASFESED